MLSEYTNTICTSTNWMYDSSWHQWTVIPYHTRTNTVSCVSMFGQNNGSPAEATYFVRPVMYLKANVSIVDEKETNDGLKYYVVE